MREVDHRFADRRVDLVGAAIGDKSAIELQLGKGQFAEPRQRRIGAAEIVDHQPHIVWRQPLGQLAGEREIVDDLAPRERR